MMFQNEYSTKKQYVKLFADKHDNEY